jgi:urea carboxylase
MLLSFLVPKAGFLLMQAAKQSKATAVHPGYGFLSESPEFVEAVEAAGLAWLGPRAETMKDFALKHVAKDIAVAANVPTMPGSSVIATAVGAPARTLLSGRYYIIV